MVLGQLKYAIDIEEAAQSLLPMHWPGLKIQSFQMLNQAEKENRAEQINELLFTSNFNTTHRFIIRSLFLLNTFFVGIDSYFLNHSIKIPRPRYTVLVIRYTNRRRVRAFITNWRTLKTFSEILNYQSNFVFLNFLLQIILRTQNHHNHFKQRTLNGKYFSLSEYIIFFFILFLIIVDFD